MRFLHVVIHQNNKQWWITAQKTCLIHPTKIVVYRGIRRYRGSIVLRSVHSTRLEVHAPRSMRHHPPFFIILGWITTRKKRVSNPPTYYFFTFWGYFYSVSSPETFLPLGGYPADKFLLRLLQHPTSINNS